METEPQIVFRGIEPDDELKRLIDDKIALLERSFDRITSCRVIVERQGEHGPPPYLFEVAVEMEVPGTVIVARKKPGDTARPEDVRVTIRNSFEAARRQLDDFARKTRGVHVKDHPERHHGEVVRLFAEQGYGFLRTPGGQEAYFQRDSVIGDDWSRLELGSDLEFTLMDGEKGAFAVNVSLRS